MRVRSSFEFHGEHQLVYNFDHWTDQISYQNYQQSQQKFGTIKKKQFKNQS